MNYEGDLVSFMVPIFYFKLWLIVIKSWYGIGVWLVLGLIGFYDVELKCLDYDLWGVVLRCTCYKDGEWFTNVPYYKVIYKFANITYMNCNERTILMQLLLRFDDDVIQGLEPMTYNKIWWLIKTFQKEL